MSTEIVMPQMGADMQEGTLLRWLKHPGDEVGRGEIIAEIETDKANIEIESFEEGILSETLAQEGQVVPVGEVIARIAARGEAPARVAVGATAGAAQAAGASAGHTPQAVSPDQTPPGAAPAVADDLPSSGAAPRPAANGASGVGPATATDASVSPAAGASKVRLRVSPVARHLADEWGVDLNAMHGSGPDGRIVRKDVEAAHTGAAATAEPVAVEAPSEAVPARAVPPSAPQEARPAPLHAEELAAGAAVQPPTPVEQPRREPAMAGMSKMRQAIARRMAQSKREAPHYYVTAEIDMTDALAFRAQLNADGDVKVSVNDLIVKACAETLRRQPHFNALFVDGTVKQVEKINICIGVALPDGLVAPALLDVGGKSVGAIAREAHDLAERTRGGRLRPAELNDGTFTISNLGMYGVETLIAIIQPPQAAILGVGAVGEKPAVRDGQIVVRQLMQIALSADHRVTDGAQGGEFLRDLKDLLEHPLRLAL